MKRQQFDIDKRVSGFTVPARKRQDEAWMQLEKRLTAIPHKKTSVNRRLFLISTTAAAAAVLLLFLLVEQVIFIPKIENKQLCRQQLWLPDSSHVTIKARTELTYAYRKITGTRVVNLKGEAVFDIRKGKPFTVNFPGGKLEVLGTKFTVQAYTSESGRIDCFEGAVKLTIHNKNFILKKGEALTFNKQQTDGPFSFNPEEKFTLPDNTYRWTNRPLKEVLMLICQREGYQLKASESLLQQRFTGSASLGNSEQALKIISTAMNFNFNIENKQLYIVAKK